MRHLVLSADYREPSLTDELTRESGLSGSGLSADLVRRIESWNERYQAVVPLSTDARAAHSVLIDELDGEGLDLADEIAQLSAEPTKVRYYSEGRLRSLT